MAPLNRQKVSFIGAIILIALSAGSLFAIVVLRPIQILSKAIRAIGGGDLSARASLERKDEMGRLAVGFNSMAEQIQTQTRELEKGMDTLEVQVQERTAALVKTAKSLEIEGGERKRLESHSQRLIVV